MVKVAGNRLVNAVGQTVQLRGANASGLEFVAVQGWSPSDPWGGALPDWDAMKAWKLNTVRLPLNEASWLGTTCQTPTVPAGNGPQKPVPGVRRSADPGNNYKQVLKRAVDDLTARGLYAILDLHIAAPADFCPNSQFGSAAANRDNSLTFWKSLATAFKGYPNVVFELFNEPFVEQETHFTSFGDADAAWQALMKGTGPGRFTGFGTSGSVVNANGSVNTGGWADVAHPWTAASMQGMLDAVRSTGATNVVLAGGLAYDQRLDGWLKYAPSDPLKQVGATWHPYPAFNTQFGTPAHEQPNNAPQIFDQVRGILEAGYPVVITEGGDNCADGTPESQQVKNILSFSDQNGVSVVLWGWNTWYGGGSYCEYILIKDRSGTPTDGYGKTYRNWLAAKP